MQEETDASDDRRAEAAAEDAYDDETSMRERGWIPERY
jgi:hypothetical protein